MKRGKKALITGITGQDGSYLAEFLLSKGYDVYGLVRRASTSNRQRIEHIFKKHELQVAKLIYGDMTDTGSIMNALREIEFDEIYNLAAQSHVKISYENPIFTSQTNAVGTLNLLESARLLGMKPKIYQASTSELFSGGKNEAPQNELTPFKPMSPYGAAKLFGFSIGTVYRESYGMFVSNGILFNHESPRRSENFVTRKVTINVAKAFLNRSEIIYLGNLDARRDWGYAPEYVESMWKILQQSKPGDYVIATGQTHSVRELVEEAYNCIGVKIAWKGKGINEVGFNKATGKIIVKIDLAYYRPNEVEYLCGDSSKAKKELKWQPKTTFKELVKIMVDADIENLKNRK
jgi:GDPmannose 4,6-dehydratase